MDPAARLRGLAKGALAPGACSSCWLIEAKWEMGM
jgi:hypothetical protein